MTERAALDLTDRVAVVTGGANGIGAAVVRHARKHGARVGVLDLESAPDADCSVRCDVSRGDDVRSALAEVESALGPPSILVNNAGVAHAGRFEDLTEVEWNRTVAVNLNSVFLCTQLALPRLRSGADAAVVNVASIAGRQRSHTANAAYAAAKGGVIAFTRQIAHELAGDGIRVNCVCPGLVDTDIIRRNVRPPDLPALVAGIPLGRLGDADEIAATICFLASSSASYVTGAVLDVNGGLF